MKKIIFIILLSAFISACEKQADISYSLKNSGTSPIKVVFTNTKDNSPDKSIILEVEGEETLAVNGQGLRRVSTYKEKGEFLRSFSKIDVFKNDTLKSKSDFLKSAYWTYKEKDKHRADYLLTVTDSDF